MTTDSSVINAAMSTFASEIAAGASRKPVKRVNGWSLEQENLTRQLWAEGVSASAIGKRVGKSRNAVIGKVHRLKLASRKTTRVAGIRIRRSKGPYGPRRNKVLKPIVKAEPFIPRPEPLPEHLVSFAENSGCMFSHLNWGKKFCGRPKQNGSYCEEHARKVVRVAS